MSRGEQSEHDLILAAEDCPPELFGSLHRFSHSDERVVAKLMGHGPVLFEGGRGSGKSALMLEARNRLWPHTPGSPIFGIYLSLRSMPLLRSQGKAYEEILCSVLIAHIQDSLRESSYALDARPEVGSVQRGLAELAVTMQKRIVLLFDDAAHIGREAPLVEFFDIFRTLSSSLVSCKATIYPGVTEFGKRFDVYNDATVLDLVRDESHPEFASFFTEVLRARCPDLAKAELAKPLSIERLAGFLGQSVLGFMRGFVIACNRLVEHSGGKTIGLASLSDLLLDLSSNYFWPLLEEVSPKLGKYQPMVEPAQQIAAALFRECGRADGRRSALIHRDLLGRFKKPFEILEYAGFLSKREASRAMKSGGRGSRFTLNLGNLLEEVPGTRLTSDLFERWTKERDEPIQVHTKGSIFANIELPALKDGSDLAILAMPISKLRQSQSYPYGLTEHMLKMLETRYSTVGEVAQASDRELDKLPWIGGEKIKRIRQVIEQAIWM